MAAPTKTQCKSLGVSAIPNIGRIEWWCCGKCGVVFGVTEAVMDIRREDHAWWYCPNGHEWHFGGENTEEKLRRELQEERDRLADRLAREVSRHDQTRADRDRAEGSLRATKGVVTKIKKRVAAGVCPCCNRSFQDLARHMKGQHPEWAE